MKLSIIIPVYNMNHDNLLKFCLDSIINQTIEDYEIIAVDDASTDDSFMVLKDYENEYPDKFKAITYPDNRRQGGAKNEGLKAAQGEWIGFVDSDDWIAPDFYEKLLKKADETGADIVGCSYSIVDKQTFEVGRVVSNNSKEQTGEFVSNVELRKKYMLHPGSMVIKIYRHTVIKESDLKFPEHIFYEDNCASRIWAAYFKHFELVEEPLYYYYQHDVSTVHTVTEERCMDRMIAMDLMVDEFKARGLYDTYKDVLEASYAELYFKNTLFSYMLNCPDRKLRFVKQLRKGMLEKFPDYKNNPYFRVADAEEEKMMNLCMKAPAVFYVYYSLLWKYRNRRK